MRGRVVVRLCNVGSIRLGEPAVRIRPFTGAQGVGRWIVSYPSTFRRSLNRVLRFRWPSRHRCPKGRFAEPFGCEVVPKIPAESRHDGAFVREPYDRVTLRRSLDRAPRGRRFSGSFLVFQTVDVAQKKFAIFDRARSDVGPSSELGALADFFELSRNIL